MVSNPVGDLTLRVSIAFGVIDTVAVALRLLARTRTKASLAIDDALITASLLPLYALIINGYLGQYRTPSIGGGVADLHRNCKGTYGIDDSGEHRARAWKVTNFNAPEAHDVRPRDRRVQSNFAIKL